MGKKGGSKKIDAFIAAVERESFTMQQGKLETAIGPAWNEVLYDQMIQFAPA